jgi:hypothetical protein
VAAAFAAVRASFPALNVRAMTSLAAVIFLFDASISAFFFAISSARALSAALGWPPPLEPAGVPGAAALAVVISSSVSRLPLPGVTVMSQSTPRPALMPATKFGEAVG